MRYPRHRAGTIFSATNSRGETVVFLWLIPAVLNAEIQPVWSIFAETVKFPLILASEPTFAPFHSERTHIP